MVSHFNDHFGEGSGDIWLDYVRCTGTESSILNCTHNGIGVYGSYCDHRRDAGVECSVGEHEFIATGNLTCFVNNYKVHWYLLHFQ